MATNGVAGLGVEFFEGAGFREDRLPDRPGDVAAFSGVLEHEYDFAHGCGWYQAGRQGGVSSRVVIESG